MDYSIASIISIVSFLIGWNVSDNYQRYKLNRYVKAKMNESLDDIEVEQIHIRVEKHGTTFIAYRVEDDKVLGEAESGKRLVEKLKEYFADKIVNIVIHTDDGADYIKKYF